MTVARTKDTQPSVKQSVEFMAKMMLMKSSKTCGYADSTFFYRKNVPNKGR
ncbi:MAG: hypothetical protein II977_09565 [Oscillospiraceae bacterium]|nr:hypothetical protein [Oscillospiraceae bacterium]